MREFLQRGDKKRPAAGGDLRRGYYGTSPDRDAEDRGNFDLPAPVVSEEATPSWRFLCLVKWALNGPITDQSTASKALLLLVLISHRASRVVMWRGHSFLPRRPIGPTLVPVACHGTCVEKSLDTAGTSACATLRPSVPIKVVQAQ